MAFDDLPYQPPINIRADAYLDTALRLSRLAALTTRCELDIPYGSDWWQKVDIYLPPVAPPAPVPVFVNIHGGGWTHGFKEWMGLNAPPIVALPAIYVSVSYRLAPGVKHPAPLEDCLAALAWVRQHIGRYGGDPGNVHIGGHSAGGHLSAMMALRRDLWPRFGLDEGAIRSCFPYSGVYDMRHEGEVIPMCAPLLAGPDGIRDASPINWVDGNRIPFCVTWSENDNPYCKAQAQPFVEALRRQPGRVAAHMFELFDHYWIHVDQQRPQNPWTRTLRAWLTGDPNTAPTAF